MRCRSGRRPARRRGSARRCGRASRRPGRRARAAGRPPPATRGLRRSRTRRRRRSGPEGNERELGIRTWRASGTSPASRSGRRRRASGLTATLTTVAVTPSEASPVGGRAAAGPLPREREQRGGGHGEARVVGGAREAAHRDVERRGRRAGDGGVDREIEALGVLDPGGRRGPGPRIRRWCSRRLDRYEATARGDRRVGSGGGHGRARGRGGGERVPARLGPAGLCGGRRRGGLVRRAATRGCARGGADRRRARARRCRGAARRWWGRRSPICWSWRGCWCRWRRRVPRLPCTWICPALRRRAGRCCSSTRARVAARRSASRSPTRHARAGSSRSS